MEPRGVRAIPLRGAPRWRLREKVPIGFDEENYLSSTHRGPTFAAESEDGEAPVREWLVARGRKLVAQRARDDGYLVGLAGGVVYAKAVRPFTGEWLAGFAAGVEERARRLAVGAPVPDRGELPLEHRYPQTLKFPKTSEPGGIVVAR